MEAKTGRHYLVNGGWNAGGSPTHLLAEPQPSIPTAMTHVNKNTNEEYQWIHVECVIGVDEGAADALRTCDGWKLLFAPDSCELAERSARAVRLNVRRGSSILRRARASSAHSHNGAQDIYF